jgi:hypothetical protein
LILFENRVLRGIFWPKTNEVTGEWRKVHNEELNELHCSTIIVQVIKLRSLRWLGNVAHIGKGRGIYRVLVGEPEGKRPPGKPRPRWEYNIKMDLHEVKYGGMDWIELAQDRERLQALMNAGPNLQFP